MRNPVSEMTSNESFKRGVYFVNDDLKSKARTLTRHGDCGSRMSRFVEASSIDFCLTCPAEHTCSVELHQILFCAEAFDVFLTKLHGFSRIEYSSGLLAKINTRT